MHNYIFDTELVRLAILFGVVISMLFYDTYRVTTGGSIAPGYLALFVFKPYQIVIMLLVATLTYLIVYKLLRPRYMLWGRRLFEAEIVVALIVQSLWWGILLVFTPYVPQLTLVQSIGFLLPGIIAHDMGRQGVRTTIWAAVTAALIVFGLITIIGAFRDILNFSFSFDNSRLYRAQAETYAYPLDWLMIAIIVSVILSIFLYHYNVLADTLRTGGFVTAAYLALFLNRPAGLLFILVCTALTYLIVTQFLMKQAILFGRTKMATMILTGMILTWSIELFIFASRLDFVPWRSFNVIAPMIVALLANDAQRQGPRKTLIGASLSTLLVFVVMYLLQFGYNLLLADTHLLALIE